MDLRLTTSPEPPPDHHRLLPTVSFWLQDRKKRPYPRDFEVLHSQAARRELDALQDQFHFELRVTDFGTNLWRLPVRCFRATVITKGGRWVHLRWDPDLFGFRWQQSYPPLLDQEWRPVAEDAFA